MDKVKGMSSNEFKALASKAGDLEIWKSGGDIDGINNVDDRLETISQGFNNDDAKRYLDILKEYLKNNRLLNEEVMVDTAIMIDPNNALMSNISDEEKDYIEANITNVPKMSVTDYQERFDIYFDKFYEEGDTLDIQIDALQKHIDKGLLAKEEAIEALAMLQGQDVEEFENILKENDLEGEGKFDYDDPTSPISQLNDDDQAIAQIVAIQKKYGKDVLQYWITSGEWYDEYA